MPIKIQARMVTLMRGLERFNCAVEFTWR
jgi:hypothetical protein